MVLQDVAVRVSGRRVRRGVSVFFVGVRGVRREGERGDQDSRVRRRAGRDGRVPTGQKRVDERPVLARPGRDHDGAARGLSRGRDGQDRRGDRDGGVSREKDKARQTHGRHARVRPSGTMAVGKGDVLDAERRRGGLRATRPRDARIQKTL